MRKPSRNAAKKLRKDNFEQKFEQMVGEYHQAKAVLETLTAGTPEYDKQQKLCDQLFASAERFFNSRQR